jgi:hypothetical protein
MAKYNVVMRWKREKAQERKRALHGDPKTKKLKELSKHPSSLSGKRKQKLLRKYRRVSYQFSLSLSLSASSALLPIPLVISYRLLYFLAESKGGSRERSGNHG